MPTLPNSAITRSSTIQVLTAHQPDREEALDRGRQVGATPSERRPRDSTIWLTPVRWPIARRSRTPPCPMTLPRTRDDDESASPRPSAMPRAPRNQLIGAMLAPAQIQNWCGRRGRTGARPGWGAARARPAPGSPSRGRFRWPSQTPRLGGMTLGRPSAWRGVSSASNGHIVNISGQREGRNDNAGAAR